MSALINNYAVVWIHNPSPQILGARFVLEFRIYLISKNMTHVLYMKPPAESRQQFIIKHMKSSSARCTNSHTMQGQWTPQTATVLQVRFCCQKILRKTFSFQSYLDFKIADRGLWTALLGFQMKKVLTFNVRLPNF